MSVQDDDVFYKGGNLKAQRAWDELRVTISRNYRSRVRDANRIAASVIHDPKLRKRGR